MRLPASFSRAHLYLALFLVQLLFSMAWLGSIQREQHTEPTEPLAPGATNLRLQHLAHKTRSVDTTYAAIANDPSPAATARISAAIAQLEQLKSEMHATISSSPLDSVAARPLPTTPIATLTVAPPIAPTAAVSTVSGEKKPFLLIGIPTMPRAADYLSVTLSALDRQLVQDPNDPMFGAIQIWVMSNVQADVVAKTPAPVHDSFERNRQTYDGRSEFRFLTNDHSLRDPNPTARDSGTKNFPGWRVRKQTRDIVRLMQVAKDASQYFLAMEDDFEACPHALRMIEHMIRKATNAKPSQGTGYDWITMKMGYGFNGFLLHNNEDLQEFATYMLQRQQNRPPDHLMTEWSCAESPESAQYIGRRPHLTYKYNLFAHLGKVSSLRGGVQANYAPCFHYMNTEVVFAVDQFDANTCAHDDLSPCLPRDHFAWIPPYGIDPVAIEQAQKL